MVSLAPNQPPKVSVNIPTLNASRTLEACLRSVEEQSLDCKETIVVDCGSKDGTLDIVKRHDKVHLVKATHLRLLGQRRLAAEVSSGDWCLFLDADQVLSKTCLERASNLLSQHDMVVLEERSFEPNRVLSKLADIDRRVAQSDFVHQSSARHGVLLPRFFKRSLLLEVFHRIPKSLETKPNNWDHAIIYHEASKIGSRIGYLPNAVFHQDRDSWITFFRHYYNYGRDLKNLPLPEEYLHLISDKVRGRFLISRRDLPFKERLACTFYLMLKGAPHSLGYYIG
jgi:glycosyltransferase involved in cell wall biosynthesis